MSFQRTYMSADRALVSAIRTSPSSIAFGLTIFQVFSAIKQACMMAGSSRAPLNLGLALVILGTAMLAFGIAYHIRFMLGLRTTQARQAATTSMMFDLGPFV